MSLFKPLCVFVLALSVAGCGLKSDPFSGYSLFPSEKSVSIDTNRYRLGATRVLSFSANDIPNTYYFSVNWSPAEIKRMHRRGGFQPVTEADLAARKSAFMQAGMSAKHADITINNLRKQIDRSPYEFAVFSSGRIASCINPGTQAKHCASAPTLTRAARIDFAQRVADMHLPNCRLGRVEPEEVRKLVGSGQFSSERGILIEVLCP